MKAESISPESIEADRWNGLLKENFPGLAVSLLLHFSALLLALLVLLRADHAPPGPRIIPIDVVIKLADQTTALPAERRAPAPLRRAGGFSKAEQANPRPVEGTKARSTREQPIDNIEARLRALSRLRQQPASLPALDNAAQENATSDGAVSDDDAAYAVRDFVRATAERHWNLDFKSLGPRRYAIPLRITMRNNGLIVSVQIVDRARYNADPIYRSISLSARNAVTLSSPIQLPPGDYPETMEMTLIFDPKDTFH